MAEGFHNVIMREKGFQGIGEVTYEFPLELWWQPADLVQVSIVVLSPWYLLKATKGYFLRAITEDGEVYSRDLNALQDYLESHFPEMHISFSFFRNITPSMILRRIRDKKIRDAGKMDNLRLDEKKVALDDIGNAFKDMKTRLSDTEAFLNLTGNDTTLLGSYLRNRYRQQKREVEDLRTAGKRLEGELITTGRLLREYEKKGASAAFVFSYSSNLQAVCGREGFDDALTSIMKEIRDAHHFEISQRLQGGRLNIYVEEIRYPTLAYQIEWAGGVLNPKQLDALGMPFEDLREKVEGYLMVFPSRNIEIDGVTKDEKKLFPAKAIQNFLKRLDRLPPKLPVPELPREGGWIGHVLVGEKVTPTPLLYPSEVKHKYISGTTQSGKSFLGRVIVENELIEGTNVLILDPTRQWCGLGKATSDERVLSRFDRVGIGRDYVRAFDIKIHTPRSEAGFDLPRDLESLFTGCSVICLKDLCDSERCQVARNIFQAIYDSLNREANRIELMVVIEETSVFLPENVNREAKEIAKEVKTLMTRIAREKAKYGCVFMIITQSLSDFRADAKVVREMIGTRFFLRAMDRAEHEYIEQYLSREAVELAKNLKEGEAIIHSPSISGVKFYVRAPFSAVSEVTDAEIVQINKRCQVEYAPQGNDIIRHMYGPGMNQKENQVLSLVREYYDKYGVPILAAELGRRLGLRGGSRQRLLDQLVEKNLVKKVRLGTKRGRPSDAILPLG
ncbi:MAG: hypothetical protein GTN74_05040 [Proteobacteria bacterium]|nr:hypothetical protein [Pseudomonadota bacterium]